MHICQNYFFLNHGERKTVQLDGTSKELHFELTIPHLVLIMVDSRIREHSGQDVQVTVQNILVMSFFWH